MIYIYIHIHIYIHIPRVAGAAALPYYDAVYLHSLTLIVHKYLLYEYKITNADTPRRA